MNVFRALVRRELSAFFSGADWVHHHRGGDVPHRAWIRRGALWTERRSDTDAGDAGFLRHLFFLGDPAVDRAGDHHAQLRVERASGTYESLMTAPIGDWQVVLSKFSGALIFT